MIECPLKTPVEPAHMCQFFPARRKRGARRAMPRSNAAPLSIHFSQFSLRAVNSEELHSGTALENALTGFAKRRKPRVEWVQQQSMAVTQCRLC
jgi:hypothetical protein